MAREGGGFDPRQEHLAGFGSPVSNRVSSLRKGFANPVITGLAQWKSTWLLIGSETT